MDCSAIAAVFASSHRSSEAKPSHRSLRLSGSTGPGVHNGRVAPVTPSCRYDLELPDSKGRFRKTRLGGAAKTPSTTDSSRGNCSSSYSRVTPTTVSTGTGINAFAQNARVHAFTTASTVS